MKIFRTFFRFLFIIGCVLLCRFAVEAGDSCPDTPPGKLIRFNFGAHAKVFSDVDIKDAKAAMEIWIREIGRTEDAQTDTYIYEELSSLERDMQTNALDLAYTRSLDYLLLREKFETRLMFASVKKGKKTERYLVLVPADAPVDRLYDLKGRRLAVRREGDIELMYLNLLLLRERQPEHAEFFRSVSKVSKASQAVMAVFFGKADLCVVSETVLGIMTELNPQIGKRLKVLAASPEVLPWSIFSRKDFSGRARELALKTALSLQDSPRGRQLLMLFQADAIELTTDADLESLARLFEEYQRRKPKS